MSAGIAWALLHRQGKKCTDQIDLKLDSFIENIATLSCRLPMPGHSPPVISSVPEMAETATLVWNRWGSIYFLRETSLEFPFASFSNTFGNVVAFSQPESAPFINLSTTAALTSSAISPKPLTSPSMASSTDAAGTSFPSAAPRRKGSQTSRLSTGSTWGRTESLPGSLICLPHREHCRTTC